MKIKALRTFLGDHGLVRRGAEITVSAAYGKELIKRGRAAEVAKAQPKKKGAPAPSEGE